jgi:uncharacterized protein (TIGR03067 family)
MIRRFALIASALAFIACGAASTQESASAQTEPKAQNEKAAKDLAKLQGQWIIAALEVNGADVPAEKLEGTVLTIKDDRYAVKTKDQTISCKITLDPAKDPKEIDMLFLDGANKDQTQKGIYRFAGETFQMVRGLSPEQNRPRDFATWPDTNYFLVTWKKK